MPSRDRSWIRAHSGPTTARRMSAMLSRIVRRQGRGSAALALAKMAQRHDPFAVLVGCIISLRTKDEVTDEVAPRLLAMAPDPKTLAGLPPSRIAKTIYPAGFYKTKARTLRDLGRVLEERHGGKVPATLDGLLALKGVGRKTANLVVTLGFGKEGICVDTHVHRISNRMGFVVTQSPDDTERVLRARLARRWWIPANDLLVTHGKTICSPLSPRCSECAASSLCPRVGVTRSR